MEVAETKVEAVAEPVAEVIPMPVAVTPKPVEAFRHAVAKRRQVVGRQLSFF
jgi:hypothetical protein